MQFTKSYYYGMEPWNTEEFSPPSFEREIREKINNLEQSRDETLDEYLWYFDSIVTSCPHHGFTNFDLQTKFLCGMLPHEWKGLNDAAGGSLMGITVDDLWILINDLAARSRPSQDQAEPLEDGITELASSIQQLENTMQQIRAKTELWAAEKELAANTQQLAANMQQLSAVMHQFTAETDSVAIERAAEPEEPTEDEDPQMTEEELPHSEPVLITNPSEEITVLTTEPTEVPNLTAEAAEEIKPGPVLALGAPEEVPDLIAELSEKDLVLTVGAPETDPVLMVEVPQLNPSCFMPIITTKDHIINDDAVQGELEAEHEPKKPTKEISLVTSQEKPPENSIVPRQPSVATTKKRPHMGICLWSPIFEGTKPNFQTRKGANYSNMKKRQRHGPKEWKPGRSNKQARLNGPAAMVKETSPSRSKRAAEKKFDFKHPWDPYL